MKQSFQPTWEAIVKGLEPRMKIRNWTVLKGYLGDSMEVVDVDDAKVVIKAPNAINQILVYREDFERVWEVWPGYKGGKVQRQELTPLTFFSKYILSIFHWLEVEQ